MEAEKRRNSAFLAGLQKVYRIDKIGRRRRIHPHFLPGKGMREAQRGGVKHLARGFIAGGLGKLPGRATTIDRVAHQWTSQMLEVHTDLVRAAGVQRGLHQR